MTPIIVFVLLGALCYMAWKSDVIAIKLTEWWTGEEWEIEK